jgi:hypothetical protein
MKNKQLSGIDAAVILISWIARSLLASGLQEDQIATAHCSSFTLATYPEIRPDLCNTTDMFLCGDFLHDDISSSADIGDAIHFVIAVLAKLKELSGETYDILPGENPMESAAESSIWLPYVKSRSSPSPSPPPSLRIIDLTTENE